MGKRLAPPRFLLFLLLLLGLTAAGWNGADPARAFMVAFDVAAGLFMISLAPLFRHHNAKTMREHADANDANRVLLLLIATLVSLATLAAVYLELSAPAKPDVALVVSTLALAWLFGNSVYALHYAHLFYVQGSEGGLAFSGKTPAPDYSDFFYFSFTLGMTFQTSDTAVTTRGLRRIVTFHSLAAFVFNIGVLAFTINTLGG